jgi:hypothetical protein
MAVVFIIAIITFMGLIFVSLLVTGVEVSVREVDSTRSLYIAEGGIEAAIGHLKQPASYCGGSNCWLWNDGYTDKSLSAGTVDMEVLHYEVNDGSAASPVCVDFVSSVEASGDNPARTIYVTLLWDPVSNSNTLDLSLFSDLTCTTDITANAKKTVLDNGITIRYRITAAPGDYPFSVNVSNNTAGAPYELRISHPDDTETTLTPSKFTSSSTRSIIALGKVKDARREVFSAFRRLP